MQGYGGAGVFRALGRAAVAPFLVLMRQHVHVPLPVPVVCCPRGGHFAFTTSPCWFIFYLVGSADPVVFVVAYGCELWLLYLAWMGCTWTSTGGNQREIDRQRAAKRAEKGGKGKKKDADGSSAKQMLTNKKEKYVARVPPFVVLLCSPPVFVPFSFWGRASLRPCMFLTLCILHDIDARFLLVALLPTTRDAEIMRLKQQKAADKAAAAAAGGAAAGSKK